MSAHKDKRCPKCDSFYLSTIGGGTSFRCIDCNHVFDSNQKSSVPSSRVKNSASE